MDIRINEELRAYIDPLTEDEFGALERSLLAEGCRDALVLWGDLLVDGHNRYTICKKHDLPFQTVQNTRFETIDDVHLWMIDNHLGRRSVSDFQRGVLALRKKEIMAARGTAGESTQVEGQAAPGEAGDGVDGLNGSHEGASAEGTQSVAKAKPALKSREAIAREARISSTTVGHIEKIQKTAAPELVAAVKSGTISINAAAAVASLPVDEQLAAVAGGKKELREAAKRVRGVRPTSKRNAAGDAASGSGEGAGVQAGGSGVIDGDAQDGVAPWEGSSDAGSLGEVVALRARVTALTEENTVLKQRIAELMSQLNEASSAS